MMYSFLLVGQSNMAGRGFTSEVEKLPNKDIYVLRNGRWWPMYVPVNPDRVTAGINLSESFVYEFLKEHPGDTVGIIPCADGGSSLEMWMPGELIYDNAVFQAKQAQRTSKIIAVLWHQGESDCFAERWPLYEERCLHIFESIRKELGLGDDVPFLVGGLGDFLKDWNPERAKHLSEVNKAIRRVVDSRDWITFVPATGLTHKGDNLHFNAAALREFGERYFAAFRTMTPLRAGEAHERYDATRPEIENL
jgi:hypothetical protein